MFILVVDDECPALNELTDKVEAVFPKAEIHSTQSAIEALEWAEKLYMNGEKLSYAFLDICMHEMDGLKLAKELFAFLVDRHGATVTTEQIAVTLWENGVYDRKMKNMATSVIASLRATLKEAGIEEVMVKTWNHLAINVEKIKCDAYEFEKGDSIAMNSFRGEYMTNYSWAEFSTGRYIL